jgi:N-acetylmuramic acid 6-phosphate etherase
MTASRRQRGPRPSRWGHLLTESRNPRSRRLDTLSTGQVVDLLLDEDRRALIATRQRRAAIVRAADAFVATWLGGGRIVLLGAGTSGRLAVLEAAECPPTFGTDPARIQAVMAGGKDAVFEAVEGAEDREAGGRREGRRLGRRDLLVGISASSVTPFVRGALATARARGARTALLTCAPARGLAALADVLIAIPSGPEVLTGSTRLKAASATKAALNAITTTAMVRLGKVYENLMVDLKPSSAKLKDRSVRIVAAAAEVSSRKAAQLLAAADGEVKTAIVMGRLGLPAEQARDRLAEANGHVRRALRRRRRLDAPRPAGKRRAK